LAVVRPRSTSKIAIRFMATREADLLPQSKDSIIEGIGNVKILRCGIEIEKMGLAHLRLQRIIGNEARTGFARAHQDRELSRGGKIFSDHVIIRIEKDQVA